MPKYVIIDNLDYLKVIKEKFNLLEQDGNCQVQLSYDVVDKILRKKALSKKDFPKGRERRDILACWEKLQSIHSENEWQKEFNAFYVKYREKSANFKSNVQLIYKNKNRFAMPYVYKNFNLGIQNIEPEGKRKLKLTIR